MKSQPLTIRNEGALFAAEAMQRDFQLLESEMAPTLRFYSWARPSITVGILNEEGVVDGELAETKGIDVARRPTGGATLLHGHDLAFSLFVPGRDFLPDTQTSYLLLNQALLRAVSTVFSISAKRLSCAESGDRASRGGYCMVDHALYDPLLDGKKVGGAAQRRTKRGLLHQGSLFITEPKWSHFVGLFDPTVLKSMQSSTIACFTSEKEFQSYHIFFIEAFAEEIEALLQF